MINILNIIVNSSRWKKSNDIIITVRLDSKEDLEKKIAARRPVIAPEHLISSASEDQEVDQDSISNGEKKEDQDTRSKFRATLLQKLEKKKLVSL